MSICIADIHTVDRPKQGIIKPGVEAELKLAAFQTNLTIPAPPEDRHTYVARRIISRVYGDIAADFEAFLKALPDDPATAARLRESDPDQTPRRRPRSARPLRPGAWLPGRDLTGAPAA